MPFGPASVQQDRSDGRWAPWKGALGAWGVFAIVMAVMAVERPGRPITYIYRNASIDWWSSVPVYTEGIHGFLYFPSSAVLFGPLAHLPLALCDQVWRLLILVAFTTAVLRAVALMRPDSRLPVAAWVLALVIPTASINLLRGQCEMMMLALLMHATIDLASGHDRRGGALLALTVALKPLALVPALLFFVIRPGVRLPLIVGGLLAFALPFLHPDPGYVAGQYAAMLGKLTTAAAPDRGRWFDLARLLCAMGLSPDYAAMTVVRVTAAGATLSLAVLSARRLNRPTAAFITLMLAVWYLVLFNPRTEEGSYLNVAALLALALFVEHRRNAQSLLPLLLVGGILGLGAHFYGDWLYRPTQMWLKQAVTLAFYGYILLVIATRRTLFDPAPGAVPKPPLAPQPSSA